MVLLECQWLMALLNLIFLCKSVLLTVAWMWAIATISPGPNFMTIAQIAASKSRSAATAAVCGTGLATVIWGVCGVAGVQAIFLAAPWAYLALKIGRGCLSRLQRQPHGRPVM